MKWLLSGNKARFALALGLSVVAYIFAGALMFTSGYMISLAATIPLTVLALHLPSIFVRIFGIGKPLLQYAYRLTSHDWVLRMTSRARLCLYDALRKKTTITQSREKTGHILSMLTEDIGHSQDLVLRGVLPVASAWIVAIIISTLAGALSASLAVVLLCLLVISCVIVPLMTATANAEELQLLKEKNDLLYENLTDNFQGITEWVISGRKDDFVNTQMNLFEQKFAIDETIRRRRRICRLVSQVLFCLCVLSIIVWAALTFGSAFEGNQLANAFVAPSSFASWISQITPANSSTYPANWIAAFALCFFPLTEAFLQIEEALETFKVRAASVDGLVDYMGDSAQIDVKTLDADGQTILAHKHKLGHKNDVCGNANGRTSITKSGARDGANKTPALEGDTHDTDEASVLENPDISIRDLEFSYHGRKIFSGFNLEIPYGTKIAITGRSGIGKSTLVSLVHGDLKPDSGTVLIGNNSAQSLSSKIYETVGVIGQFPHLFDMSLRENLLIAKANATDEELKRAMTLVGLEDMYNSLLQGLDTQVLEGGLRFSGGERHRIALARILLSNQPIVVLDEPFSNIDVQTVQEILDTLLTTFADKTLIVVTHHAIGLDKFDQVLSL